MKNEKVSRKAAEQLRDLTGNEIPKNQQLVDIEQIKGSPLTIVGNDENGYFLAVGKHRLGGTYDTKNEVLTYLRDEPWTVTTNLVIALMEIVSRLKEIDQENEQFKHQGTQESIVETAVGRYINDHPEVKRVQV